jgi:enamine deaminase RidA (YjgF/YER057c/UK114 family)
VAITRIEPGSRMSQAVVYGGLIYTSGQVDDSASDVAGQTRRILGKIDDALKDAGSDKSHLIAANIWLSDIAAFDEMNTVWEAWIDKANPPARATVESKLASPKYKVEIAVVAAVRNAQN